MPLRRQILRWSLLSAGALALGGLTGRFGSRPVPRPADAGQLAEPAWRMPDEAAPHQATWMAFGGTAAIWGSFGPAARQALARVAAAIADFEPVNMLVRPADLNLARQLLDPRISLVPQALDDLWLRDTGPLFVFGPDGGKAGVDANFNGWGDKPAFTQPFEQDRQVAGAVCRAAGVPAVATHLVFEGGGIEVDGQGTALITESCLLNPNRNPGLGRADCEHELRRLLGLRKIIWLPGIAGKDVTDGHTDFYARFVRPGLVVAALDHDPRSYDYAVTRRHLEILRAATDADGRRLQVETLAAPATTRQPDNPNFAAGYVNFYVCNGGVLLPEFGDAAADAAAQAKLAELFPDRRIVPLEVDAIAAGGGGIHCMTQQEPKGR